MRAAPKAVNETAQVLARGTTGATADLAGYEGHLDPCNAGPDGASVDGIIAQ